jgi:DNA polymerase-1
MMALIDFDLVVFRCAASAEEEPLDIAIHRTQELLDQLLEKTEATSYRAFLSGKGNFRKTIYPEYKAQRSSVKPKHLQDLREFACSNLGAEVTEDDLEADDYLGIFQTDNTVIVSLDKDLLQIPGHHYRWGISTAKWVKEEEFIVQTELEGLRLFYEQCLKGDTSDNVKGVKGIGEKGAKKLLAECETEADMINVCLKQYATEEEFLMNAQCLYILRSFDDDYRDRLATALSGARLVTE